MIGRCWSVIGTATPVLMVDQIGLASLRRMTGDDSVRGERRRTDASLTIGP